jgi:nicotinamidase/pyrazinamidase
MEENTIIDARTALLVIDVQRDFCGGGALAVKEGDRVVPALKTYIDRFTAAGLPIFFTRDWHPPDHSSFKSQGGPWPVHCVAGSPGAEFHPDLPVPPGASIVDKGREPELQGYSGFEGTTLHAELSRRGVRRVLVGGLATDYCVRATVLDARGNGYEVHVLLDAVRGVDVEAGDSARALEEMRAAGARVVGELTVDC